MVVPNFKIGDEVETTEEYRQRAEELNPLLSTTQIPPYIRGNVTAIREQIDYKTKTTRDGCIRLLWPQVERKWISVTIDGGILLNQDNVQKVQE